MDSLYGGHQGISFVLKASYQSVAQMISAFKNGANYKSVWYGEYCLIDTPNKNDADNGKIYRRGLDYQNNMGGAEYIGQIVGPSSGTPYFQMDDLDSVKKKAKEELEDFSWKKYPTGKDVQGNYTVSTNGDGNDISEFTFGTDNNVLIPGKKGDIYNDKIKYTWVNIRNDNADSDSWFYVGFQIPYLVVDYQVNAASPYNAMGNRIDLATIERIDNESHPFYEEWRLNVPKGIKGDTLTNLRVIVPQQGDTIYDIKNITTSSDPVTGRFTTNLGTPGYTGQQDDINKKRSILVFDYSFYDNTATGTTVMVYVADYNLVRAVNVDEDGTLRLTMTHEDEIKFEKKIRWLDLISLTEGNGQNGGHFTFTYNNDNPRETDEFDISWIKGIEIDDDGSLIYTYAGVPDSLPEGNRRIGEGVYRVEDFLQWISKTELNPDTGVFTVTNNRNETIYTTVLDWIKRIQLDQDGTIHLWHTKNNQDEQLTNAIKWVTDVSLNPQNGQFRMNFNYGAPLQTQLDWVDDVFIDENSGEIALHHVDNEQNTGTAKNGQQAEILDAKLKLVVSASVTADGIVTFVTNTGETITLGNTGLDTNFQFTKIDDIRLQTPIAADKHIQIKYNTKSNYESIGDPINYIQDMVVRPEDFHLLVLYNDPTHRASANDLDNQSKDKNGITWVADVQGSDGTNYGLDVYWRDYGTIKDQSGILIGFNVTEQEVKAASKDNILDYLNEKYPNGLTGSENAQAGAATKHKIVTYSKEVGDDKEFYAFDYNLYKWYYLGKLEDSGMRDARLFLEPGVGTQKADIIKTITTNGLLFTSSNVNYSTTAIPTYWDKSYNAWT